MDELTLLLLQATPASRPRLDLGEEQRAITTAVEGTGYGSVIDIATAQATRPEDLLRLLLKHRPHLVHFAGHADPETGIVFTAEDGGGVPVGSEGLCDLLREVASQLTFAYLSACWSAELAGLLADAIGTDAPFSDPTAAAFARDFYRCIAYGQSIGTSFRAAQATAAMYGRADRGGIHLYAGSDVNPDHVFPLPPQLRPPPSRRAIRPDSTATTGPMTKTTVTVNIRGQFPRDTPTHELIRGLHSIGLELDTLAIEQRDTRAP